MSNLLMHERVDYDRKVVMVTGNSYRNCTFRQCTMIIKSLDADPRQFEDCRFHACSWHFDVVIHDPDAWRDFLATIGPVVEQSLPP